MSEKKRLPVLLMCLFLGLFGVHRFYVGKKQSGFWMLLTSGGLGLWVLYDLILIISGDFTDSEGKKITAWN